MKRRTLAGVAIIAASFAFVLWLNGGDWTPATAFGIGVMAALAAAYPLIEQYITDELAIERRQRVADWISPDPYAFAKSVADAFAGELDEAEGDQLGLSLLATSHLAASLDEIFRRAQVRRHEEILRSRTWHP